MFTGERLHDVSVGLTNSSHSESTPALTNYVLCASHPAVLGPTTTLKCFTPTLAQYVIVQLNTTGILTLCEVMVYGPGRYFIYCDFKIFVVTHSHYL